MWNFVVKWAYYCYLAAEARPLLDVSALGTWLVYWLTIVHVAAPIRLIGPMAAIRILQVDLGFCLVNNRLIYHPWREQGEPKCYENADQLHRIDLLYTYRTSFGHSCTRRIIWQQSFALWISGTTLLELFVKITVFFLVWSWYSYFAPNLPMILIYFLV